MWKKAVFILLIVALYFATPWVLRLTLTEYFAEKFANSAGRPTLNIDRNLTSGRAYAMASVAKGGSVEGGELLTAGSSNGGVDAGLAIAGGRPYGPPVATFSAANAWSSNSLQGSGGAGFMGVAAGTQAITSSTSTSSGYTGGYSVPQGNPFVGLVGGYSATGSD